MALTDKLTAIADAIRGKTGGADALTLDAMAAAIAALETGGGSIRVASGTIVPANDASWFNTTVDLSDVFSASEPVDLFLLYRETEQNIASVSTDTGLHCVIEEITLYTPYQWDETMFKTTGNSIFFGYIGGTQSIRAPGIQSDKKIGSNIKMSSWKPLGSTAANMLAGVTYHYYAFGWGVN